MKTKKQQLIDKLMEGTNYSYPNIVRERLNKRTLYVIEYWMHRMGNAEKEMIIDMIIRIG